MNATIAAVRMKGISKAFGGVRALDRVDIEVLRGEVHALLGGNGAGKSTILKILNGIHRPDEGTIDVLGVPLTTHTAEASRAAGIAMNFQEMSLIPTLTVAQNIFLTRESRDRMGLIDDADAERRAAEIFALLEVAVDPKSIVADLGAGQKQLTEIAKAISRDAKVLILDEPSTALAVSDVERLFVFLRKLKSEGVAIIYVSHRMDEIARIADRATILRDGRHVITAPLSELPIDTMIEHIVGKRSKGLSDVERGTAVKGEVLLELHGVSGAHKPDNISLSLHRGEVLGLAGLLGSGRSALARVIAGIEPARAGRISVKGRPVTIRKPSDAIGAGIALVPEARATQGIIPSHSVESNMTLAVIGRLSKAGFVDGKAASDLTDTQIKRLAVKTASRDHAVSTLSGGNQQKVVIGKWLATDPDILVLDEPTAGIDIGSKSEIIRLVRELAASGKGVIMISSELSELLTACDRILVMSDGRVHQDLPRSAFDDSTVPADDTAHRLQAAEQRLQIEIQRALKAKEVPRG
ncbi:ATP-binding cassette domain-containing protein [Sinorhizobium medicae]|uniref:sugar ABC transporter ATP-binding protein n=1 Tax=Sinorhizobium medicae TaxID=110321 RepID=UPI000FD6F4B5|nr:sugar ABC transporter ATP-binding protein [Sinorhizobium medicae]MDX0439997.1 ATP-binding cassette domain-containing protein [Sinorhizobium medicae]MDX0490286.1 ATP-binding cassette domain-containing protein [Sinorhizobium medicae]MDX0539219.1 ATP-binding cassette domain-containing protein [Sinorhizobium medicae]MDX0871668.1 ATP-binding cassette domain-containing protein [Sinorhizobium medicae]MDX0951968.1 ATP-binding cassette domain-containing protein [Sinorhizobium medicae]